MYEVYVLRSIKDSIRYVGSGEDSSIRLARHNKGDYKFTKGHRPWRLIYNDIRLVLKQFVVRNF